MAAHPKDSSPLALNWRRDAFKAALRPASRNCSSR
jgi:hypothetical protein